MENDSMDRAHRRRRKRRRALLAVPVTLGVLVTGAYVGTAAMDVPPPHVLAQMSAAPPSAWGEYFVQRDVEAGEADVLPVQRAEMPSTVPWKGGGLDFEEFLAETHTNSFLVLQDGAVAHEWYADGFDADTLQPSFSMAKSVVSLLVGQAIGRGELAETDRLVDVLPDWGTGTSYDEITIRHLLDMTAGVDVSEVYHEYWPFTGTSLMYLVRDLPEFLREHRTVDSTPGERAEYRSVHTALLGLVLEEVTGKDVSTLLSEDVWKPMGAEQDARWSLDDDGGHEKSFAELHASPRDFARLGQLVLEGGRGSAAQVVPEAWTERMATPAPLRMDDWGYSAQWWHPPGGDGDDFTAIGIYGQYTYVNPTTRTVVVKLSNHGTEQDEQETIDVFRAVAQHLSGS